MLSRKLLFPVKAVTFVWRFAVLLVIHSIPGGQS